jgi:hypothetical protein
MESRNHAIHDLSAHNLTNRESGDRSDADQDAAEGPAPIRRVSESSDRFS